MNPADQPNARRPLVAALRAASNSKIQALDIRSGQWRPSLASVGPVQTPRGGYSCTNTATAHECSPSCANDPGLTRSARRQLPGNARGLRRPELTPDLGSGPGKAPETISVLTRGPETKSLIRTGSAARKSKRLAAEIPRQNSCGEDPR